MKTWSQKFEKSKLLTMICMYMLGWSLIIFWETFSETERTGQVEIYIPIYVCRSPVTLLSYQSLNNIYQAKGQNRCLILFCKFATHKHGKRKGQEHNKPNANLIASFEQRSSSYQHNPSSTHCAPTHQLQWVNPSSSS